MSSTDFGPPLPLPDGIQQSYVPTTDLTYNVLSCGDPSRPLLLLLHGFPELAFSWRKVMMPLSKLQSGFHVVAYDQRGYGRTTGWDTSGFHDVDLKEFSMSRLVTDAIRLVNALGKTEVHCVIGHDFGAVAASMCALMRPDFFKAVVIMSHPFKGAPNFPLKPTTSSSLKDPIHDDLASLNPPRKAYKWYYSTAPASNEMSYPPDSSLQTFLRGYFHLKSADWKGNKPHALKSWTAEEVAQMPGYYVMPLNSGMRETVAQDMADEDAATVQKLSARWLPDSDLAVYAQEFGRNSFQGGLNWYRRVTDPEGMRDVELFAGKKIEVPCLFIAGEKDWGIYQEPGAVEGLGGKCERFFGVRILEGAGHWVQQERPEAVVTEIAAFLEGFGV